MHSKLYYRHYYSCVQIYTGLRQMYVWNLDKLIRVLLMLH